jgi:mannose-6-phosphate isomerase-like protein (cupin superfamily)
VSQTIDIARTFIHLGGNGGAEPISMSPSFWRGGAEAQRYERVVGAFNFRSADDLHSSVQEMHPEVDEVLLLISGAVDVVLEEDGAERTVALESGQAAIVPRGVWHRLVARRPGRVLFVNNRRGMRSRPLRDRRGDGGCGPT